MDLKSITLETMLVRLQSCLIKARVAKLVKAVGLDPATFAGSTPVLGIISKKLTNLQKYANIELWVLNYLLWELS